MRKNTGILILIGIAVILMPGMAYADSTISFEPATLTISQGSSGQATLFLSEAPEGLAGYHMEVSSSDPGIAEISSVSYPPWGKLTKEPTVPARSVLISAVDLDQLVQSGSTKIPLATLTLQGIAPGTATFTLSAVGADADGGSSITPTTGTLQVTVPASGLSVPTPVNVATVGAAIGIAVLGSIWLHKRRNS